MLEKIQDLCVKFGTNISRVERECGLSNATIRRWGTVSPSVENVVKVADYFGVSVDYLLGREVYRFSEDAQKYAIQFDELPDEKKQLALAYMSVVRAQK